MKCHRTRGYAHTHPTASRWLTRIVFRNRYASFIDRQGRARPPVRSCQCHCLAAGHCLTWSHPVGLSFGRVPVFIRERRYYVQHDHLEMSSTNDNVGMSLQTTTIATADQFSNKTFASAIQSASLRFECKQHALRRFPCISTSPSFSVVAES